MASLVSCPGRVRLLLRLLSATCDSNSLSKNNARGVGAMTNLVGAQEAVPDHAEFKSTHKSNFWVGLGLLIIPVSAIYIAFFLNEDVLLETHARRGGIMKLIEQSIGWVPFSILLLLFGAWATVYSIASFWKLADSTPDLTAYLDRIEFHPAVRRRSASYDEISHWRIEIVSGHPVLWIHFRRAYWSLQGLFRRRTVKLEGDREQLTPVVTFFSYHPVMSQKFAS